MNKYYRLSLATALLVGFTAYSAPTNGDINQAMPESFGLAPFMPVILGANG